MNLEQKLDWKIQKLERALDQANSAPEVAMKLAEAYFQKGYYLGKGDEWFLRAIERVSDAIHQGLATSEACTLLANALYGRAEYDAAGEAYRQALALDPRNALALVGLGNLEKRRGDFRRAREFFQKASDLAPSLWQAHYNLGEAYYQEAKSRSFQDAERLLEKAIFHLIRSLRLQPFENFVPNIHKDLGELFLHVRQFSHARRFFGRLTSHDRYGPIAHYYLGITNYSLGKYNLAIQNFRNFLRYEPKNAQAWSKIGLAYLDLKQYAKAREVSNNALHLDSENVLALFVIGCSLHDERNYPEAQTIFERILTMAPTYFPAYVEWVKSHYHARDYQWLYSQLHNEIKYFEQSDGYDGGRHYYGGERGIRRRRIDVLLAQIREMGPKAFPPLLDALKLLRTDSLCFQIWEDLYSLSRQARAEEILRQLSEPEYHLSKELGRTVLLLSPLLPEEAIFSAFNVDDERIKRGALSRLAVRDDVAVYMRELERTRTDHRELQGYLLRALAIKGTAEAEAFLSDALNLPERSLRLSAAVALVYYGHEQAIQILEQECVHLDGAEEARIRDLIRIGRTRHSRLKLVRSPDVSERPSLRDMSSGRREDAARSNSSCAMCGRGQREVERLLAGNRLMVCTGCVQELWKEKRTVNPSQQKNIRCHFCQKSIYEVDTFYSRNQLYMCNLCLDLCMGVVEHEEIERFLQEFN